MSTIKRICNLLFVIFCAVLIVKVWFTLNEPTSLKSTSSTTTAAPVFNPTEAMRDAIDPGDSFRRDGWRFEFGEFTERDIDVWVYWPSKPKPTLEAVEIMGSAFTQDAIQKLKTAGFDAKQRGTSITYFFRQDIDGSEMSLLGSAGYMGSVDKFYFSPPK
ncbi:hypothetical protein [Marinobacterium stanieri]|uniref:Uncharacterized protein n=1 Tax=Marinobacterium stanieri TaxID=49186 RepID=A0A1N6QAY6_9GAMM|nr:hypothetical protein [Marinobacterium stanieri]SIQ13804.1 hypothetical protein SAMN05421647_102390 [Marinobacterium stanieri]